MGFLEKACRQALERVRLGYYDLPEIVPDLKGRMSLTRALSDRVSLICEIKPSSPTAGRIRMIDDPVIVAKEMVAGGADALSILTDPENFHGSIEFLIEVSRTVERPTLMKDFLVSRKQVEAAERAGASAILLIHPVFTRGHSDLSLEDAVNYAHELDLEVVLEVYDPRDLEDALEIDADFLGVNSRNLDTLDLSLDRAYEMIESIEDGRERVILESGIKCAADIRRFLELGVNKFLVGTAIMSSRDIGSKIREIKGVLGT
ncbi:MAG: indole-3-glycerol-phosphate synthase [Aigarchaeota archaeon]|nr:indole-3-glycerol-phosphate synthase [Aigarchaeota archaeon]